jgi:hypothetical protein
MVKGDGHWRPLVYAQAQASRQQHAQWHLQHQKGRPEFVPCLEEYLHQRPIAGPLDEHLLLKPAWALSRAAQRPVTIGLLGLFCGSRASSN